MDYKFDIIEYISGLTAFILDDTVLRRIAVDRGVMGIDRADELDQRTKDLLKADILMTVYLGPENTPSFQRQHGQFSTSTGAQKFGDKGAIRDAALALYNKWGEEPEVTPDSTPNVKWINEVD